MRPCRTSRHEPYQLIFKCYPWGNQDLELTELIKEMQDTVQGSLLSAQKAFHLGISSLGVGIPACDSREADVEPFPWDLAVRRSLGGGWQGEAIILFQAMFSKRPSQQG